MRGGGARACLAASRGEQDDLLARRDSRRSGPGKGTPVPEVLDVDADHTRVAVRGERLHELRRLDVGLVPEGGEPRDTDAVVGREEAQLEGEVAALGDDPELPRGELVRAEVEVRGGVVHAEAVGAEHDGPRLANALHDGGFPGPAGGVDLAEPRRDRHNRTCTDGEGCVDRLLERACRQRDDDELGSPRQLLERAVRRPAQDRPALTVDEPHVAPVGAFESPGGDPLTPLGGVVGSPKNGDRSRIEERSQIAHAVSLAGRLERPRSTELRESRRRGTRSERCAAPRTSGGARALRPRQRPARATRAHARRRGTSTVQSWCRKRTREPSPRSERGGTLVWLMTVMEQEERHEGSVPDLPLEIIGDSP